MTSLVDQLNADRPRYKRALSGLIAEQEAAIHRLRQDLAEAQTILDRGLLKLVIFVEELGRGSSDTITAQREAEDANTVVGELARKLERQHTVLEHYRKRLNAADDERAEPLSPSADVGAVAEDPTDAYLVH